MNITAVSIAPIFRDYIHGGSQRVFMDVANHMSLKGHKIKVLCTKRYDNNESFSINDNFEVHPILEYRETFPLIHDTPPYRLLNIIKSVEQNARDADILYVHADGFYFKQISNTVIPVLTSLHDFVYPISMVSAFLCDMDKVIVPSDYIKKCLVHTVGELYEDFEGDISVIPNGIDQRKFKRDWELRKRMREKYDIGEKEKVILFPHRPDETKGITNTLKLMNLLINYENLKARLAIPKYIDLRISGEAKPFYDEINNYAKQRNFEKNMIFFDWVLPDGMPGIYNMSDLTLCIGSFVESFGLVPLESACCGTPVIASKSGALRYTIHESLGIPKIDFDDLEGLAHFSSMLLKNKLYFDEENARNVINSLYPYDGMLNGYESAFVTAKKKIGRRPKKAPHDFETYKLSPWCYLTDRGVYNDYEKRFFEFPEAILQILSLPNFDKSSLFLRNYFDRFQKDGLIVGVQ